MEYSTTQLGDVLKVTLEGSRLDSAVAQKFKASMIDLLSDGHTKIALDMSQLEYMDSGGLGALVGWAKLFVEKGDLAMFGLQGSVHRLFKLTRMTKAFQLCESETEALSVLNK